MVRPCRWRCRLCPATGTSRTPVDAFWWHYRNTHQVTATKLLSAPYSAPWGQAKPAHLTPITSIFHGTGKP